MPGKQLWNVFWWDCNKCSSGFLSTTLACVSIFASHCDWCWTVGYFIWICTYIPLAMLPFSCAWALSLGHRAIGLYNHLVFVSEKFLQCQCQVHSVVFLGFLATGWYFHPIPIELLADWFFFQLCNNYWWSWDLAPFWFEWLQHACSPVKRPLHTWVQWLRRPLSFVKKGREQKWTASVQTLHMLKPVMTFVFKVLRNGLLRYILYTCSNLWWRLCVDTTKTFEKQSGEAKQRFASFFQFPGHYIKTEKHQIRCKSHDSGLRKCLTSPSPEEACYHVFVQSFKANSASLHRCIVLQEDIHFSILRKAT